MTWDEFLETTFKPKPGEHFVLIAPTGAGKTTAGLKILPAYKQRIVLCSVKPTGADSTINELEKKDGYKVITEWPPPKEWLPKVIVWPKFRYPRDIDNQKVVLSETLEEVFADGDRVIFLDDLQYWTEKLNLAKTVSTYLYLGRSAKVSTGIAAPRPRWVPRIIYSACTHIFIGRTMDGEDSKALGELGGYINKRELISMVQSLGKHDFLYLDTRTGKTAIISS